jgi:Fe-S cluster biosynthesis and repair protein YggX
MTRLVFCTKLQQEAEGLDQAPFPGSLGQKIFDEISKPAWQSWLNHQTMLINEYRLNLSESKSRDFLREEMKKFLFGAGSAPPEGYKST